MRSTAPCLRLALAGLLAVVSLLQMPSMVFAPAGAAALHHEIAIASHDHNERLQPSHDHHAPGTTDDAQGAPACHLIGCCLAISPSGCSAPSALYRPLGPLEAAPARAMAPALPDLADPPPRLQA
jgi:hypothetical protein